MPRIVSTRQNVTVTADLPGPEWRRYDRVVKELVYPVELGTFANFGLPETGELGDYVPARPRVDLLPPRGMILWLTLGDRDADQAESAPFANGGLTNSVFATTPALATPREEVQSMFGNVREYRRSIGLGTMLYVDLWAWVGMGSRAVPADLQSLVRSLRFGY